MELDNEIPAWLIDELELLQEKFEETQPLAWIDLEEYPDKKTYKR